MASTSRPLTNLLLIVSLLGAKLQEIIEQPNDVRVCVGENATFTCTVNGQQREDITSVVWEIMNMNGDFVSVANRDCHILTKTMNSNGDLTENLTIVNVTMSDNGVQYRCNPIDNHLFSNNVSLIVAAPPDTVTNLTIPLDLITSTSFVAHWSEPSSDVVCGTYVVTVSTGGIIVIRNVTISRTTYNATGLCENTKYRIIVTVLNERGNSLSASMEVTTTNAVPTETKLTIISVQPLTSTSFTFNWVPSDPNYNYTVIWTNLHTGVMYNRTVPGNTNSYIVTGLSDDVNYNVSVAAVNRCGMMTSDPVTAYDPPNKPEISYCISYNNGQPLLQLFAYVMVDVPRMSLMLQFLTSYQAGTPKVMDANCSDIQNNIQYNCTAELTVDIIPSVEIIQSVNVTVRGPYGSNCSVMEVEERANAIVSVESFTTQDNATLICELACLSTGIQCVLFNITPTRNVGNITGSLTSYNPPTEQITLNNLISGRAYNFCVIAINMTDMMEVGHPVCDSFSTMNGSDIAVDGEGGSNIGLIIGLVIGALLLFVGGVILVVAVVYHNIKQRRNRNNPKDCDNLNSKASSLGVKNYSNQSSNDSENSTTHLVKRQCSIQSSSSSQQSSNEEDIDDETDEAVSTTQVNHNIYRVHPSPKKIHPKLHLPLTAIDENAVMVSPGIQQTSNERTPEVRVTSHDSPDGVQPPVSSLQANRQMTAPSSASPRQANRSLQAFRQMSAPASASPLHANRSLQVFRQMSAFTSHSEEYIHNSYYDPTTGKSFAMPKLIATKRQYTLTQPTHFSRQMSAPATCSPPDNFSHWNSITSLELKETKF